MARSCAGVRGRGVHGTSLTAEPARWGMGLVLRGRSGIVPDPIVPADLGKRQGEAPRAVRPGPGPGEAGIGLARPAQTAGRRAIPVAMDSDESMTDEYLDAGGIVRTFRLSVYGEGQFLEAVEQRDNTWCGLRFVLPILPGEAPPWGAARDSCLARATRRRSASTIRSLGASDQLPSGSDPV